MISEHQDYKQLVTQRLEAGPRKGRGEYQRIAAHLKVNSSLVSQIFRGSKHLTLEQASGVADYLGFNDLESDYFLQLVVIERAGTQSLRRRLNKRLVEVRNTLQQVENRLPRSMDLDEAAKATFYSNWYFSGIRLLSSINGCNSVESVAAALNLPRSTVRRVVEFLLATGLCQGTEEKFDMGPQRTHVSANSPLVSRHHSNWRIKGMQVMERQDPTDLFFTSPMTIGIKDIEKVRSRVMALVEETSKIVDPSPSQQLRCLNIDWFGVR